MIPLGKLLLLGGTVRIDGERRELRPWVVRVRWTPIILGLLAFALGFAGLGVR